jgi:hypothetical protein
MNSNAGSSSALAEMIEDAITQEATHGYADGPLTTDNQDSSTPHQPDKKRPSNNPKLDEMLQLF